MEVFKIKAVDVVDYDQYESIVVTAEDKEQALKMSEKFFKSRFSWGNAQKVECIKVDLNKSEVLCASYNAG